MSAYVVECVMSVLLVTLKFGQECQQGVHKGQTANLIKIKYYAEVCTTRNLWELSSWWSNQIL